MTNNDKNYEELESLIDYDIYQYSSNPDMLCDEISLAGYIAANLTMRGYCKVNEEQIRKDTAKEILQEVWACAFYNNPDRYDDYLDDGKEDKTLTLWEYTGHHGNADDGICPICGMAIDLFHDKDKCPLCGKEW